MRKKVIVAGHICLDITPIFPDQQGIGLEALLRPGQLVQMKEADVHTGGCVANTGLAMKKLGADVSLMGKIGKDPFGDMVMHILEGYHAGEGMLVSAQESTSYSVILAVPGVDRIFLHNPGANDTFRAEDVPDKELSEAALLHFGYPPIMKQMYQKEGQELRRLLQRAKAHGASTSLDLAAVDEHSEAGKADWKNILESVLPYVDFFVPSAEELCYMLDRPRLAKWQQRADGGDVTEHLEIERDIKPLAERCMELGVKVLLIKCGAAGMYYRTAGMEQIKALSPRLLLNAADWADREGFEKSYVPDRVLSGTGAGDTSIAAFLTAMLKGCDLEQSVRLATATGASCVAAYDALSGLKSLEELEQRIAQGWKKA